MTPKKTPRNVMTRRKVAGMHTPTQVQMKGTRWLVWTRAS